MIAFLKKTMIIVVVLLGGLSIHIFPQTADDLSQIKTITRQWERYKQELVNTTDFFLKTPRSSAPYQAGALNTPYLQSGLAMTNFIRYLAHLPKVSLSPTLNKASQYGAVILVKLNYMDHYPPKPTNMPDSFYEYAYKNTTRSNLYHSSEAKSTLMDAIRAWMDDSDSYNIATLGHRRWIINPSLVTIGFGQAIANRDSTVTNMVTMEVMDTSGNPEYDYVAWPSASYFPLEFFHNVQAWNVSLNPTIYDKTRLKEVQVSLTETSTNNTWVFSDSDQNSGFFTINTANMGIPFSIIFMPKNISYKEYQRYEVRIDGIYNREGKKAPIQYEVMFFTLD